MNLAQAKLATYGDDLPYDDNPVIAAEPTPTGWRGLTQRGELLEVRSSGGVPEDLVIMRGSSAVARRKIERGELHIDEYTAHYDRALKLTRDNHPLEALSEIEATLALAPTLFARFNRAMILLALGRWREGFAEYRQCEDLPPLIRPPVAVAFAAGLKPWCGEDLAGKRLLLIHAHGFGDSIMALRYVPLLKACGAEVILQLPHELLLFGEQLAEVTTWSRPITSARSCTWSGCLSWSSTAGRTSRSSARQSPTGVSCSAQASTSASPGRQARNRATTSRAPFRSSSSRQLCRPTHSCTASSSRAARKRTRLTSSPTNSATLPIAPRRCWRWIRSSRSTLRRCISPAPSATRMLLDC